MPPDDSKANLSGQEGLHYVAEPPPRRSQADGASHDGPCQAAAGQEGSVQPVHKQLRALYVYRPFSFPCALGTFAAPRVATNSSLSSSQALTRTNSVASWVTCRMGSTHGSLPHCRCSVHCDGQVGFKASQGGASQVPARSSSEPSQTRAPAPVECLTRFAVGRGCQWTEESSFRQKAGGYFSSCCYKICPTIWTSLGITSKSCFRAFCCFSSLLSLLRLRAMLLNNNATVHRLPSFCL